MKPKHEKVKSFVHEKNIGVDAEDDLEQQKNMKVKMLITKGRLRETEDVGVVCSVRINQSMDSEAKFTKVEQLLIQEFGYLSNLVTWRLAIASSQKEGNDAQMHGS